MAETIANHALLRVTGDLRSARNRLISAQPEVDVLAVPINAPWSALHQTVDFLRATAPARWIPIHDALLRSLGRGLYVGRTAELAAAAVLDLAGMAAATWRRGVDYVGPILQASDGLVLPLTDPHEPVSLLDRLPEFANPDLEIEWKEDATPVTYADRKAIHNLKYFTWVEQQAAGIIDTGYFERNASSMDRRWSWGGSLFHLRLSRLKL